MSVDPAGTPYDLERLRAAVQPAALIYEPETASTNDVALRLVATGEIPAETLIVTSRQTAGRGRGENRWWSADGAITFSAALDAEQLELPPRLWPCVALTTAVAICDVVSPLIPPGELAIKWPNDVFLNERKLAGILVETASSEDTVPANSRLIVGVGLNLTNSLAGSPQEIRGRAVSVSEVALNPGQLQPTTFLIELWQRLRFRLCQLAAEDVRLAAHWQQLCLLRGRTVTIHSGETQVSGLCHGTDSQGALLIHQPDGIQKFYSGVVIDWQ